MAFAPRREPLHQVVIPSALEHRARDARDVAGEHKAVVILHFVGHAQVQPGAAARLAQRILQSLQFLQRRALGLAPAGGAGGGQRCTQRAVQVEQAGQRGSGGFVQPRGQRGGAQLVGVLGAQEIKQLRACLGGDMQRVQQAGQVAHVADFQHGGHIQRGQALQGQPHHGGLLVGVHRAHALQSHLVDGLEGVALAAGAADLLIIIKALALPCRGLGRLGDGQRYVGLDGPQLAVQVGEGDDLCVRQKALILLIQGVFLKAGRAVFAVASLLIQGTQAEGRLFGGGKAVEFDLHNIPTSLIRYRFYYTLVQ